MQHTPRLRRLAGLLAGLLVCAVALAACGISSARPNPAGHPARPEVDTRSVSSNEPRYHATWPQVRGARPLSDALEAYVDTQVRRFVAEASKGGRGGKAGKAGAAAPELNINWTLVADDAAVVGVRLERYLFSGANGATSGRTWWFDRTTGRVRPNGALVRSSDALRDAVLSALQAPSADPSAHADVDRGLVATSIAAGIDDLDLTKDGRLRIRFAQYDVAPGSSGVVTVILDQSVTRDLLTPFGLVARKAVAPAASESPDQSPSSSPGDPTSPAPPAPPVSKVDCRKEKCIALTFDDGPVADTTRLLRILRREHVPATFFVLGQQVQMYPDIVARAARQGHEIGIHTWDHRQLTTLAPRRMLAELARTQQEVADVTGVRPTLLRPPYGASNPRVLRTAGRLGLAQVLWSIDTRDWKTLAVRPTVKEVRRSARPGRIILMHDIHRTSVDAVPRVIAVLRRQGYRLVTVSELLGRPKAGHTYSQR